MYLREIIQIYRIKQLISIQLENPGKDNDGSLVPRRYIKVTF